MHAFLSTRPTDSEAPHTLQIDAELFQTRADALRYAQQLIEAAHMVWGSEPVLDPISIESEIKSALAAKSIPSEVSYEPNRAAVEALRSVSQPDNAREDDPSSDPPAHPAPLP